MPVNRGRGQTTRWYKICFVPTSADSSDDSDTESIIIAHDAPTTTTRPELSPPAWSSPPPNPQSQIDWRFPPPPPPPAWSSPPPPDLQPQVNSRLPPPPPPPDLEPQINSRLPPPPPPPPPPDGEPEIDWRVPPPPLNGEPEIDWRFPPPPPPPPITEPQIDRRFPPPRPRSPSSRPQENIWSLLAFDIELRNDRYQQQQQPQSPSHQVFEADQQSVNLQLQVPIDVISSVRISELHEIENLSHSHCPICLEEFKVGDRACRLPCIHTYCSECILRWLNNNKTCPVCRLQLDDWETPCDSYSIDDDDDDDDDHGLEPETLQIHQPILTNSSAAWELLFTPVLSLSVTEDGAGYNSEIISDYDSACDELGDSHEDGHNIVGASLSGCC